MRTTQRHRGANVPARKADVVRSPRYATAVGLLLEGRDQFLNGEAARAQVAGLGGVAERMKLWFKANF